MNASLSSIKSGIVSSLKTITLANSYSIDVTDDLFYSVASTEFQNQGEPETYPRFSVVIENGVVAQRPSRRTEGVIVFLVLIKTIEQEDVPAQDQLEKIIDDVSKCINANTTLNGTVKNSYVVSFRTDGGATAPEGNAIVEIQAEYDTQY